MTRHEDDNNNIKNIWDSVEKFYEEIKVGLNIVNVQPGCGKTYGFTNHIKKYPGKKIVYFSTNHNQLSRVEKELKKKNIKTVHWEGFTRKCQRYPKNSKEKSWSNDEKFVYKIYKNIPGGFKFICDNCKKNECQYNKQFDEKAPVVLAPLEFIFIKDVESRFDEIWIDESIEKIIHYNWNYTKEKFDKFISGLRELAGYKHSLEIYPKIIDKLHKEFLKQTSMVFTHNEKDILTFNKDTYKSKIWQQKGFLQKNDYVAHLETIDILSSMKTLSQDEKKFLIDPRKRKDFNDIIKSCIRGIVHSGKDNDIVDNYFNMNNFFGFFDTLLKTDLSKGGCIVSEQIVISNYVYSSTCKDIVEDNEEYEKGFLDDKPYLFCKKTKIWAISEIGKEYTEQSMRLGLKRDSWLNVGTPYIFNILKIAEIKPIVLMDATFNKNIFNEQLYRYFNLKLDEKSKKSQLLKVKQIDEQKIKNKKSTIYKIIPAENIDSNYPLVSLESGGYEKIYKQLKKIVKQIKEDNKGEKVGAIMHQAFEKKFKLCPKNHFFNQRGTNKFKNVNVLIVIGTPYVPPNQILYSYVLKFGQIPKDTTILKNKTGAFECYQDKLLEELSKSYVYDELYQAIHRCRPLIKDKTIILFGKLVNGLEKEMTCKKLTFDGLYSKLSGIKEFYLDNPYKLIEKICKDDLLLSMMKRITLSDPKKYYYTPLVTEISKKIGLTSSNYEDAEEILLKALSPVKEKIINLLRKNRWKRLTKTRLIKGTKYNRDIALFGLWLLEKDGVIEIKPVKNSLMVFLKK